VGVDGGAVVREVVGVRQGAVEGAGEVGHPVFAAGEVVAGPDGVADGVLAGGRGAGWVEAEGGVGVAAGKGGFC
jgi:hypothetical protein